MAVKLGAHWKRGESVCMLKIRRENAKKSPVDHNERLRCWEGKDVDWSEDKTPILASKRWQGEPARAVSEITQVCQPRSVAWDAWPSASYKTTILPAFRLLPSFSELKHHPLEIVLNKNTILCIIWFTVASDGDISGWMMRNQCDWSYRSHASNVLQKSYAYPWRRSATLHDLVFLAVQYVFFPESFCRISG